MAKKVSAKAESGASVRTKVVGVRLDPKLRYLAELAARKQRRSLSSFIETVVEESLNRVILHQGTGYNGDEDRSIADEASELWDVDDAERFARLAILYEDLLSHEEQVLWKLIKDSNLMWIGGQRGYHGWEWDWDTLERDVFPQLRANWTIFRKVAQGEASRDELPQWESPPQPQPDSASDIPF